MTYLYRSISRSLNDAITSFVNKGSAPPEIVVYSFSIN
jgi:hypothetical protein